ncbi:MAG: hypothetical protein ACOYBY_06875 [Dermatophilaceae bacterium]
MDEYRDLERHLRLLGDDPRHLVIVGLAGLGGIGKSRFLGEVASRFAALADPPTVVSVALENPPLTALTTLRDAVDVDCHLFDVALATYGAATEPPLPPSRRALSWWTAAGEQSIGVLEAEDLPVTFAVDRFEELDVALVIRRGYERARFAAIDALRPQPDELLRILPEILGRDVAFMFTDPARRRLVFLYDGYEDADPNEVGGQAWLPRFVRSVKAGIHVVTSRNPIRGGPETWGKQVEQRPLGELPDVDCRKMIRRELGDHLRRDVEDRLLVASGRIPFYLHVSIGVCRALLRDHGAVDVAALPSTSPGMVERLLDHLTEAQRTLTVAVASVQYFDEGLFKHLVRDLELGDLRFDIADFREWFFVAKVDRSVSQTHDLLTDFVRRGAEMSQIARRALASATQHVELRINHGERINQWAGDGDRLVLLFRAIVGAWQQVGNCTQEATEALVSIGYALYDDGYWRDLNALPVLDDPQGEQAARLVAQYFAALSARRSEGPLVAIKRLELLEHQRALFGKYQTSFTIELAYLREISGDYTYARGRFREMNEAITSFDGTRRDHIRTRLYYADMLTMDGRLLEASRLLLETYETVGEEQPMDWAELVRHRGHAHRFALDFQVAQDEYLRAHDVVRHVRSMEGKLRTNIAETQCWLNPARGVREAEEAIDLNARLGSRIEVCKAQAALAVALSGTGQFDAARDSCGRALAEAERLGYRAGGCFAHQARIVTEVRAGDQETAVRSYWKLDEAVKSLSTYGHLRVVPAWFLGDDAGIREWSRDVQWTDERALEARLRSLVR